MAVLFRNIICCLVASVCCLCALGCDALYRLLDENGAQERDLVGEIVPHERNAVVEEVQALLYLYGYNVGKVDGILGLRTRNAVEQFQKDTGLESNRFIDKATFAKLTAFKDDQLVIERQLNVLLVQKLLKKAGFDPGELDGKMGIATKETIKRFQSAHQLKVDGKIGYKTLNELAGYINR
jgi:peptidoglycan hydrolase-like protein with peptidoglycan-binding domain